MKISYNWLKEYTDLDLDPEKAGELLTGCGLEVENLELFQSVKGGLKGIVIGEVLKCEKHPGSDHLTLTTVDIGQSEPLRIVCGAPNVATGQKVPVATLGTTLYLKDKELTIQVTKIRGERSEGMICAEDELGLGTSHAGIMVLDPAVKTGITAREYFKVEEDHIFTIGLTPNRSDAASHLGVARDLVAVLNNSAQGEISSGKRHYLQKPDVSSFKPDNLNRTVGIIIEDGEACPRYTGLTITGITVKESPSWLKTRLQSVGLRPVNNVVDITNFILMELGQPLHAFDADQIAGNKVIVKKYPEGTSFTTLDGIERKLSENDLMICNEYEPMCIAGVFGGIFSGVTDKTTAVFLESAYFDPKHIRKTARYHGLQTDASFRFERGADYDITCYAIKRAALLIKEIASGEISSEIVDVYPKPITRKRVTLNYRNLDRLVGKTIDRKMVANILTDLGMEIPILDDQGLQAIVPACKTDVTREADLIEEVLRIYGYNNIEISPEIRASLSYSVKPDPEKVQNVVSGYLSGLGFHEIINNSFTKSSYYQGLKDLVPERCVRVLNPVNRDLDVLRQTLLFGGLETILYNQNRKAADLKCYEFGTVYSLVNPIGEPPADPLPGYHEETHLGLFLTGRKEKESWNIPEQKTDFFELKGTIEGIFKKLAISPRYLDIESFTSDLIHQGLRYSSGGKDLVIMGTVSPLLLKALDCKQPVIYAELNWTHLLKLVPGKDMQYREIPKFPEVRRDLALLVDQVITFEEIEKLAFQTEQRLLHKVGLFDVYEGEKIEAGKKSYAISFILQDKEKTLTDAEIDEAMNRLIKSFTIKLHAQIR